MVVSNLWVGFATPKNPDTSRKPGCLPVIPPGELRCEVRSFRYVFGVQQKTSKLKVFGSLGYDGLSTSHPQDWILGEIRISYTQVGLQAL